MTSLSSSPTSSSSSSSLPTVLENGFAPVILSSSGGTICPLSSEVNAFIANRAGDTWFQKINPAHMDIRVRPAKSAKTKDEWIPELKGNTNKVIEIRSPPGTVYFNTGRFANWRGDPDLDKVPEPYQSQQRKMAKEFLIDTEHKIAIFFNGWDRTGMPKDESLTAFEKRCDEFDRRFVELIVTKGLAPHVVGKAIERVNNRRRSNFEAVKSAWENMVNSTPPGMTQEAMDKLVETKTTELENKPPTADIVKEIIGEPLFFTSLTSAKKEKNDKGIKKPMADARFFAPSRKAWVQIWVPPEIESDSEAMAEWLRENEPPNFNLLPPVEQVMWRRCHAIHNPPRFEEAIEGKEEKKEVLTEEMKADKKLEEHIRWWQRDMSRLRRGVVSVGMTLRCWYTDDKIGIQFVLNAILPIRLGNSFTDMSYYAPSLSTGTHFDFRGVPNAVSCDFFIDYDDNGLLEGIKAKTKQDKERQERERKAEKAALGLPAGTGASVKLLTGPTGPPFFSTSSSSSSSSSSPSSSKQSAKTEEGGGGGGAGFDEEAELAQREQEKEEAKQKQKLIAQKKREEFLTKQKEKEKKRKDADEKKEGKEEAHKQGEESKREEKKDEKEQRTRLRRRVKEVLLGTSTGKGKEEKEGEEKKQEPPEATSRINGKRNRTRSSSKTRDETITGDLARADKRHHQEEESVDT